MVDAAPFRALRYDTRVVGDPASASAPAYDELEPFTYAAHRTASPYTVLDLITRGEDGYASAAATLERWRRTGVLVTDPAPRFYRYEQHELRRGVPSVQRGVLAAVRLPRGRGGDVLAHEDVDPERVAQRRERLEAVPVEVSPVYAFADDPSAEFRDLLAQAPPRRPLAAFTDDAGVDHRVWPIDDPSTVEALRRSLSGTRLVIADGHHRLAAAMAARERWGPAASGAEAPWDRTLMYIVDTAVGGPEIRAIHRLVRSTPLAIERLRASCHVTAAGRDWWRLWASLLEMGGRGFGLYLGGDPPTAWLVRPREEVGRSPALPGDRSPRWRALDAAILDRVVLPGLGVPDSSVEYRADAETAADAVDRGAAEGLFLLRPVSVGTVASLAAAGEPMPPKTTYFRPKPRAGLVMRLLAGDG